MRTYRPRGGLRRARSLAVALLALLSMTGAPRSEAADSGLFAPADRQMQERLAALGDPDSAPVTAETLRLLLDTGQTDRAAAFAVSLVDRSPEARAMKARVFIEHYEFELARPVMDEILAANRWTDDERSVVYLWLATIDDAARIDSLTAGVLDEASPRTADLLAAGRLAYTLLDYDRAGACYDKALATAQADEDRADALAGQGLVLYKRRDYDGSLGKLTEAMNTHVTANGLVSLAETLIRVGRTDDAIAACEQAIRFDPYHMIGHYYLGNGYARKNYTELYAAYPDAFSGDEGKDAMAAADAVFESGVRVSARRAYTALINAKPGWADPLVRMASLDFEDGKFQEARELCFKALALCPEYGRAHATLAKALESQKFAIDVHRPDYEARFEAQKMPEVPGIEAFVLNWKSLSPRHQKRVALSIDPWKQFIPVLVAGGSTYYIKPLYMLLSETPGQESLRDQRISYDSRLWDDVRGCGGYHTVTGIEDVERTIFDRYSTVLHELTHQVHGVMTADQAREIQELYRKAKERDDATQDGFLSRYAGGSVWEYFAEGANALESPKRDKYDTREIVKERLETMDPDLMALVKKDFALTDVEDSYPVAFVNAGYDRMEQGEVKPAIEKFEAALERKPDDETAMQALVYGLAVAGDRDAARAEAEKSMKAHPTSGSVVTTATSALWHSGMPLADCVAMLEASRAGVRAEDRYQVDQSLGNGFWTLGEADNAIAAYDSVLAYQSDNPEALWGKAASLALAGRWDEAFTMYDQAVRLRTGVVALRCDYARDLLLAGPAELAKLGRPADAAEAQLAEAKLLDAEDPAAESLRGFAAIKAGDTNAARAHLEQSLAWGPWNDLAAILLGRITPGDAGKARLDPIRERIRTNAPPEYVYREKQSTWISVHELPAVERRLLEADLAPGGANGSSGGSK